jgi:hypothetical protein
VVSWGHNKGFRVEFEHTATADPSSYLAAPEGIALLREWDFDACVRYMHGLAGEAAGILTERWRTTFDIQRYGASADCLNEQERGQIWTVERRGGTPRAGGGAKRERRRMACAGSAPGGSATERAEGCTLGHSERSRTQRGFRNGAKRC